MTKFTAGLAVQEEETVETLLMIGKALRKAEIVDTLKKAFRKGWKKMSEKRRRRHAKVFFDDALSIQRHFEQLR